MLDFQRFVTLVCDNAPPSTLTERFVKNYNIIYGPNRDDELQCEKLHPIKQEEYDFLYQIFERAMEPTLSGYTRFVQSAMEKALKRAHISTLNTLPEPAIHARVEAVATPATPAGLEEHMQHKSHEQMTQMMVETPKSTGMTVDEEHKGTDDQHQQQQQHTDHQQHRMEEPQYHQKQHEDGGSVDGIFSDEESEKKPMLTTIKLTKEIVENIFDNMKSNNKPITEDRKLYFKNMFQKFYVDNMFDLEMALKKVYKNYVLTETYAKYMQQYLHHFLKLLQQAHSSGMLNLNVDNIRDAPIYNTLKYAHESSKCTVSSPDTRPLHLKNIDWKDIRDAVFNFSYTILEDLKDARKYVDIPTSDIQSAIRMRLYTHDIAPRRDEYRSLISLRDHIEGLKENYFNNKTDCIILEDYSTYDAFSMFKIKLEGNTADLLDYLRERIRDKGYKYLFARKSDKIMTPEEWEELCMNDFQRVCGHKLSTLDLRYLYLQDPEVRKAVEQPFERIQTIVNMGHTLKEHFTLCMEEDPTGSGNKKRKAEDFPVDAAASKSQRKVE